MSSLALHGGPPAVAPREPFRWPPIDEQDVTAIAAMTRAGELSYYGREGALERLETAFASYVGVEHVLGLSSGTAALHSAYFGLGLGPGDEVLAPTYTFLATVMPLFAVNAIPVLVDAEDDTGNISVEDLERRVTARTKAVVVTHLWGSPCDMEAITALCRRHGLLLVEDCSHAHGALCAGRPVGSFGDAAAFSLQGKKLVAAGQGGLLVTPHREVLERAALLGHFKVRAYQEVRDPARRAYAGTGFGLNYRMHPLAAALAERQLGRLEEYVAGRRHNLEHLAAGLADVPGVEPPPLRPYMTRRVHYSFKPLYRPEQLGGLPLQAWLRAVEAEGVPIEKSETPPLHREPVFQTRDPGMRSHGGDPALRPVYADGDLPASERYAAASVVLPPVTVPDRGLMDEWLAAFAKVAAHADELRADAGAALAR